MRHFTYFHCYAEELWEGYERNGILGEHFGIRCPQTISLPSERLFNSILKKGGRLYNYIKEHRCPLYIDRLQGGGYFFEYDYDKALIEEYRDLLGKDFLGFQFHEWLSNYKHDTGAKLGTLPAEKWTEENILDQLKRDVEFGWEKCVNERGISAELMALVVKGWCRVLENGLDLGNDDGYYHRKQFLVVARHYGWPLEESED